MRSTTQTAVVGSIPAQAGIGLRAVHQPQIIAEMPKVAWFEAHSENYFAAGGAQREALEAIRGRYPLSLHGVGLSLGSVDELDTTHLHKLKRLVDWSDPDFVSEHLSWGSVNRTYLNDLLPLPYTDEALRHMVRRVGQLQDYLGRQVLIENISSYLQYRHSTIAEWEFLATLSDESGCGLLLDVNNVYVSACNHGFDAQAYLQALPVRAVKEMHLAGHSTNFYGDRAILIDTHSTPVCDAVWRLYADALRRFGRVPTLIEWDTDIPDLAVLLAEADTANRYLEACDVLAA